jgi:hypothetical protein
MLMPSAGETPKTVDSTKSGTGTGTTTK